MIIIYDHCNILIVLTPHDHHGIECRAEETTAGCCALPEATRDRSKVGIIFQLDNHAYNDGDKDGDRDGDDDEKHQ